MEAVECRYRGRVIGWLVEGQDGFLRYESVASVTVESIIFELDKLGRSL